MKTKTIIELNQEDLVDLISTATYGSNWLDSYAHDRAGVQVEEGDCIEDVKAKCLLAGKKITFTDYYAEGETYGDLESRIVENGVAEYLVGLDDIVAGLQKCADGTFNIGYGDGSSERAWLKECYAHFSAPDEGRMQEDLPEAEALMQVIIFGELIYG